VFIDIFLGWLVFSLVQSWSVFLSLEIDLFYVMLVLVLFIGVPPIYDTFCSVVPLLSVSVRLVQRFGFNNVFAVKKKVCNDDCFYFHSTENGVGLDQILLFAFTKLKNVLQNKINKNLNLARNQFLVYPT
jgi:hypothetical protein